VIGARTVVALTMFVVVAGTTLSGCAATPTDGTASAYAVKVGDCVDDGNRAGTIQTVKIVPCEVSHDSEAFSSVQLSAGRYPGAASIQSTATKVCKSDFETFAGIDYSQTKLLDFSWYHPTSASWKQGDRTILCFIESTNSRREAVQTVGSLRDAQR
jgi:Septum formation